METDMNPDQVLAFWRDAGPEKWFEKNLSFDDQITEKFGEAHEAGKAGEFDGWQTTPEGMLGLIILLDQFARNIHRDSPQAFAADEKALALARAAIDKGFEQAVDATERQWFFMPLMHSERLEDQEECIALCEAAGLEDTCKWAELHADIIRRFGRFPHRNALLDRTSSDEEAAFLKNGGFAG